MQLSITQTPISTPSLLPDQPNHYFLYTDGSKTKEANNYAAILTDPRGIIAKKGSLLPALCSIFEAEPMPIIKLLKWWIDWFPTAQLSWFTLTRSRRCRPWRQLRTPSQSSPKPKNWPFDSTTSSQSRSTGFQAMKEFLEWAGRSGGTSLDDESQHPHKNVGISWSSAKNLLQHLKKQWSVEWASENNASHITKRFFPFIDHSQILQLIKPKHKLIQILSGHNRLSTLLHRIAVE